MKHTYKELLLKDSMSKNGALKKGVLAMECRGSEKRRWIVENYSVVPVAHIQLLAGQTKHSDAGATIENEYYIFYAIDKQQGEKKIIQCGMTAASDLLKLINHGGIPLFNPLHVISPTIVNSGDSSGRDVDVKKNKPIWNQVAKQLYNAIMWLIIIIDAQPNTPIYNIRETIDKYKYKVPYNSQVKAVNTIISKSLGGKTLTEEIEKLKAENDIRENMCQFNELISIINNYTDKEGNKIELPSYF